jgi:hypothetical protein
MMIQNINKGLVKQEEEQPVQGQSRIDIESPHYMEIE